MRFIYIFICFIVIGLTAVFAGNPVKDYIDNPSFSQVDYETIDLVTPDNFTLKSWICKPDKKVDKQRVLVLAYGDSGNMSYWLRQVLEVVKSGYTVVMFDYRGYGESQSFVIDQNQLYYDEFATDLQTAITYAKDRFSYPIGIWALSSGTILSVLVGEQSKVDFIVSEGFMSNLEDIQSKMLEHTQKNIGLPNSASTYQNTLSKLSLPILFFAGNRDGLTTLDDMYRVSFLNKKSSVVVFNGGHLQAFQALTGVTHGERYITALNVFCDSLFN